MTTPPSIDVLPDPRRRVYCNRTLNMRSIEAVGCDMDYTLVHYHARLWEERAYDHAKQRLLDAGLPVQSFRFDPELVTRGLVLDLALGNILKANRFGYVTRAAHGTHMLEHDAQRRVYAGTLVDLSEPRWVFLNTLFSLSEGCLYAQLVDLLDGGQLPNPLGYSELYDLVKKCLGEAHTEGELKAEIVEHPERFVVQDPDLPLALLDMKHAGKKLMIITNSEWSYTQSMMRHAFDPHLPGDMTFRELFDVIIVEARKPTFFTSAAALFELADEERGLFRPVSGGLQTGRVYLGGHARLVEEFLGLPGENILYLGDHLYADVHVSKDILRWRTALIVHELEEELSDQLATTQERTELAALMAEKTQLEHRSAALRVVLQRADVGYVDVPADQVQQARAELASLKPRISALDEKVTPLVMRVSRCFSHRWGPLMRAGGDKSRMARMLERYADVYMSRVSNLVAYGPFAYLRASHGSLPHDV